MSFPPIRSPPPIVTHEKRSLAKDPGRLTGTGLSSCAELDGQTPRESTSCAPRAAPTTEKGVVSPPRDKKCGVVQIVPSHLIHNATLDLRLAYDSAAPCSGERGSPGTAITLPRAAATGRLCTPHISLVRVTLHHVSNDGQGIRPSSVAYSCPSLCKLYAHMHCKLRGEKAPTNHACSGSLPIFAPKPRVLLTRQLSPSGTAASAICEMMTAMLCKLT